MQVTIIYHYNGDVRGVYLGTPDEYARSRDYIAEPNTTVKDTGAFIDVEGNGRIVGRYVTTTQIT
jgi:hypothetical protein